RSTRDWPSSARRFAPRRARAARRGFSRCPPDTPASRRCPTIRARARASRPSRCRRERPARGRCRRATLRAPEETAYSPGFAVRLPAAPTPRRARAWLAPPRGRSTFCSSSLPLLTSADGYDQQHDARQGHGQDADVQHLQRRAELLDAAVEIAAHGAQVLADPQLLVLEAPNLLLLLRSHQQRRRILTLLLQLAETPLGLGKLGLQALLRRAELRVGLAPQRVDARERPREGRAAAEPDQIGAAGEVIQRVDDEVAVARKGR